MLIMFCTCLVVTSTTFNVWLFWRMRRLEREFEEFLTSLNRIFPEPKSD